ncbi:MAG: YceI family protein [Paludibacter sp.]
MKTLKLVGMLLLAAIVSASAQKSEINTAKSTVVWTGNKIGGSHTGDIKIKEGYFEVKNGVITGGKVVIDMNSMTDTDLKDEGYKQKLIGHLKSDDFFGVEKYPTANFTISKPSKLKNGKATVTGLLTIKGKSEPITFDIVQKGAVYTTQLKVDRSKYDVRYGSKSFFDNIGDKAIDDIFILDIQIAL